jgi:cyanate permease
MSATHNFLLVRQNSPIRWLLGAAAAVAAAAHLPVIQEHLEEAPYMGVLFIVLTGACFALALAALVYDTRAVYAAAAVTCSLAIIGYAATRLVAFPMLADDVGNWLEPLGVLSVASEAVVVVASVVGLRRRRHAASRPLAAQLS